MINPEPTQIIPLFTLIGPEATIAYLRLMEAVILIGIQASGKSTFYRQRLVDTHIRINLDMLGTRRRERILVNACLEAQQRFVVDNTNVTREERARFIAPAREAGFRIVGYYFQSNIREAIERNSLRSGRQRIPEKGIGGTYKRLQLPRVDEGFDLLYYVTIGTAGEFITREWTDEL